MKLESINTELAVRYMGGHGNDISAFLPMIEECEKRLISAAEPKYVFKYFDIIRSEDVISLQGTDVLLTGNSIKEHLEDCTGCFLLCATLSSSADRLIRKLAVEDMSASYVTDCLASAAIEDVCDAAEAEMREKLPDRFFTWRFSPGYGDLPLELQPELVSVMNAGKRIGLSVSDSLMMIPTKSVTAVIGVSEKKIERSRQGCRSCNMYDTCNFRKGGSHCGF